MSNKIINQMYRVITKIGSGQYGVVILCQKINSPQSNALIAILGQLNHSYSKFVAIKKFHSENHQQEQGIHFTTIRQIKLLRLLNHPNIIKAQHIFQSGAQVFIVMQYAIDLVKFIEHKLSQIEIRSMAKQILNGLKYLHQNWVIHRDLTPLNILINEEGLIKISDFGMSRKHGSPKRLLTKSVCTRQYRAPQIDFGCQFYTQKIDVWSAGCTIAFLVTLFHQYLKKSLFFLYQGENDFDLLGKIFYLRGSPNNKCWPNCQLLPIYKEYEQCDKKNIADIYPQIPLDAAELIQQMLDINPNKRPSIQQCLQSKYFADIQNNIPTLLKKNAKLIYDQNLKQYNDVY